METPTGSRSLKDSASYWVRAILALAIGIVLVTVILAIPVAAKMTGVTDLKEANAQLRREVEQSKRDLAAEKAARLIAEAEHRKQMGKIEGLLNELLRLQSIQAEGYGWMKSWVQRSQEAEDAKKGR